VNPKDRKTYLDALRAVAILLVIGHHYVIAPNYAGALSPLAHAWHRFGWTGVDLFFVLSGYLIGGLLFKEISRSGSLRAWPFIARRAFKLWPSYFVFLGLVAFREKGRRGHFPPIAPNLLHVQNYWPTPLLHTWSLGVEEHFYLALPILLLVLLRFRRLSAIPSIALALVITCAVLRCLNRPPFDPYVHQFPTHLRIDSLFVGVLLAWSRFHRPDLWIRAADRRWAVLGFGLAMLTPFVFLSHESPFVWTVGYTMLYLGYAAVSVFCVTGDAVFSRAIDGWLAKIGMFSFGIYLIHMEVGHYFHVKFNAGWLSSMAPELRWSIGMGLYVVLAAILGAALFAVIERPGLAIRDRLFPAGIKSAPESPTPAEPRSSS
jgi:peptidoglycan/LPS O-acetylase OafA/YrhL